MARKPPCCPERHRRTGWWRSGRGDWPMLVGSWDHGTDATRTFLLLAAGRPGDVLGGRAYPGREGAGWLAVPRAHLQTARCTGSAYAPHAGRGGSSPPRGRGCAPGGDARVSRGSPRTPAGTPLRLPTVLHRRVRRGPGSRPPRRARDPPHPPQHECSRAPRCALEPAFAHRAGRSDYHCAPSSPCLRPPVARRGGTVGIVAP
jgi:hypothetical protein